MRIKTSPFPSNIKEKYQLAEMDTDAYCYVQINKGMYDLKEAAELVYDQPVNVLKEDGYKPIPGTTGLWNHTT